MSTEASSQAAAAGENAASEKESRRKRRWETLTEVVEVLVLAILAVATSYSSRVAPSGPGYMPQYRNPSPTSARMTSAVNGPAQAAGSAP